MRIAITLLCFLCGYLLVLAFGILNPTGFRLMISDPIELGKMLDDRSKEKARTYTQFYYYPERTTQTGVTINKRDKSYGEYTFFLGTDTLKPVLIDKDGNVVHTWNKGPADIWTDPEHPAQQTKPSYYTSSRSFLDPDTGDAYTIFGQRIIVPPSFGFAKIDKDDNIVWKYDGFIHHDIAFSKQDDRIYALGKKTINEADPDIENITPPFLDEFILVLDGTGKEIKKIFLLDFFKKTQLNIVLEKISAMPADPTFFHGDVLHSNTIEVIPDEAVGKAPMLKKGHLMLSFRNLDLLAVIDPETETLTWASYGPWKGQHDPEIQADGTVIMFDNLGNLTDTNGASRILQVDLNTMGIVWEYGGTQEHPFFSPYNSSIHVLPNTNILVTESHAGRIFEITRDKEIVWEYWNPKRLVVKESAHGHEYDNTQHIASIFSGMRYSKEELEWLTSE